MASAAQVYSYGWTQVPHSFFRYLPRVAKSGVRDVVGLILDFTTGTKGRPDWTQPQFAGNREVTVQVTFARLLGVSKDTVSRDLIEAEALGLIRHKVVGRTKQYQAIPENFGKPPQTRNPRVLSIRRQPSVAHSTHHTPVGANLELHHNEVVTTECSSEYRGTESETTPLVSKSNSESFEWVGSRTPDNFPGCSKTEKSGSGGALNQTEPKRRTIDEFSQFCLTTITPKLASVPPKNILDAALRELAGAPVRMLETRILLKLQKITAWGILVLLAQDVHAAWKALGVPILNRAQYRLDEHWNSSTEVRRLHADPSTPAEVKREILLMWPELAPRDRRKTKEDEKMESYAKTLAWARERDREQERNK